MAEVFAFSLASRLVADIISPPVIKAYEKGVSIWEARDELAKLRVSVETIHAVLLDAETKQEGSAAIANWIKRVKGVLYDADDLFDKVVTEDLIKKHMMEGKEKVSLRKKVHVSCFKLNPIVSRNSISKKVKAIRKKLIDISTDMAQFQFVRCRDDKPMNILREEKYIACSTDENFVIGRDEDKKAILDMLISEPLDISIQNAPVLIAIDGIGGMGKTTLANLICDDEKVKKCFTHIWFSCLSNTPNEIDVLRKIYQVVCEGSYSDLSMSQLEKKIKESIKDKKYLLVLDDVWEDDRGRWINIKSLLRNGGNGSRIIVTTRLVSVVTGVGAVRAHNLKGLSKDDSWYLFKSLAFVNGDENDSERGRLGRKMLKRCRGLPLAIWCIGNLLYKKTIQEWREIEQACPSIVGGEFEVKVRNILKLSYYHLPSKLKWCFIYCSLFPKDYRYNKRELIYHWIAQGYISFTEEESSFMHLLRMGFFQEVKMDELGEIESCKMHDIMHDLALHLIGEEGEFGTLLNVSSCTRHLSLIVDYGDNVGPWDVPPSLLNAKLIRSCMLRSLSYWHLQPNLDKLCSSFKLLRTLTLSCLKIEYIPSSIGKLRLVRYLDVSENKFEELPDSITNLVNLLVLKLDGCRNLKVWPRNFKNLIKLQFLKFDGEFYSMPEGIAGMENLQYLSNFVVQNWSELDGLNKVLERVRSCLLIKFDREIKVDDEGWWQLPTTKSLKDLKISSYPGHGIKGWGNNESEIKLERLQLESCENVKYLPSMSCLLALKCLHLRNLPELEFLKEEEEVNTHNAYTSQKLFPCLKELVLDGLEKLKGWSGKVAAEAASTSSQSGFPGKAIVSLEKLSIQRCSSLTSLYLASPGLQEIKIDECDELTSIELDQILSLRSLTIKNCKQLMSLQIEAHLFAGLEEIVIEDCLELTLRLLNIQDNKLSMSSLKEISVIDCKWEISLRFIELTSLRECNLMSTFGLQSLHIPSPHLRRIDLFHCVGLTSVEVEAATDIDIMNCFELKNFFIAQPAAVKKLSITSPSSVDWVSISNLHECNYLREIELFGVDGGFVERLLLSSPSSSLQEGEMSVFKSIGSLTVALTSLEKFSIDQSLANHLKTLIIKSPHLKYIHISNCNELTSVELESQIAHIDGRVRIDWCTQLKNVRIPRPIALKRLEIVLCLELSLSTGVDWDSLLELNHLAVLPLPPPEEIPQCLLQRQALGNLQITQL